MAITKASTSTTRASATSNSPSSSATASTIKRHAQRFLLFDYRLNVIKRILVYVLITTRFVVEANDFGESSKITTTTTAEAAGATLSTMCTTKITATEIQSKTQTVLNSLLNRTSSDIFMSDDDIADVAAVAAVGDVVVGATGLQLQSNFGTETKNDTNQNAKEFRKRNKRNTRDDLLFATTVENLKASTSTKQTAMATMVKLSTASNSLALTENITTTTSPKTTRILSRSKRFLTFPEGSSFSVAVCFTVGIIGNPRFNYMAFGLNWGVAYDLPNTTWVINHLHGYSRQPVPVTVLRRRTRRALYREIELVVDNMGYNGRDCVLRALCESRQYFSKNKLSMIGEMMRVIFSLPKQRIFTRELHENSEIEVYDRAYRRARDISCEKQYDCTFSLLELAFGKYSTPPEGYYK